MAERTMNVFEKRLNHARSTFDINKIYLDHVEIFLDELSKNTDDPIILNAINMVSPQYKKAIELIEAAFHE